MPQISVVIPVFNGEKTILDAIRSVLSQTFRDLELIVIDDGSDDSTPEILRSVQDERVKIYSYPNSGLSSSRNRGLALASGEFISFLDADDLWIPNKLEAQINALKLELDAAVAYSWTDFIDASGSRVGYGIHHTANGNVFQDLLVFFFVGSGSNALIRKRAFDEVGGFDESLASAEDWDLFLRLSADYHFVAVPEVHILYRILDTSMSSNVLRQERECLRVIERAFSKEPGKSFIHLKSKSYSNLYLYLAGRTLRGQPSRSNGMLASRYLWKSLIYNPRNAQRIVYISNLILKILTVIFLSPPKAHAFRARLKSLLRRISDTRQAKEK